MGWLVAGVCLVVPVYGTYTRLREGGDPWSKAEQMSYDVFTRSMWSLGVAWVITVCATNNAGQRQITMLGQGSCFSFPNRFFQIMMYRATVEKLQITFDVSCCNV